MGLFDGSFDDPSSMYPMLGLLQGLGQASMPSRLPVPMGAVLGDAAGGLMQGMGQQQAFTSGQLGLASGGLELQQKLGQANFLRQLQGLPPLTAGSMLKSPLGMSQGSSAQTPPLGVPAGATAPPPSPQAPMLAAPQIAAPAASQAPASLPTPSPVATPTASPASNLIPPDLMANPIFQAAIQSGDSATVMSLLMKHQSQFTPQEIADANLPPDSLAFHNPDGTIDIKRVGTIKTPAEMAQEHLDKLLTPEEIQQQLDMKRKEAAIQPPSVERDITLPLLNKIQSGQPLTDSEKQTLNFLKPAAILSAGQALPTDANSTSLIGQTGLSQAAIDWLTKGARPRGQQQYNAIQQEITDWSRKNGVDTGTLQSQATAFNNILQNNIQRNNQGKILENEIQGSVGNLSPMADDIGAGKLNVANVANLWLGKQVNDPTVQKYRDQLLRLQQEVAGYNSVAGGKLTENGTARVDEGDLRAAGAVLANGINSGGLQGLAQSIAQSTTKNRAVLGSAIDDANQGMWSLFGVGQNYKRQNGPPPPSAAGGNATPAVALPKIDLSPANLAAAALKSGQTVDQLKAQLRAKGYQVQ